MKFAAYFDSSIPVTKERDRGDVLRETIGLAELVEDLGLDGVFFPEHHFTAEGYDPVPMTMCAAIATRTKRVAIGTNVLLLPLHHPLHVIEQAAVIDQIAGGRFHLGLGLGYRPGENEAFGIDRATRGSRMDEGLAIIRSYLQGERFSFEGRHFQLHDVEPVLQPVTGSAMPLWVGARASRAGTRAGRFGCSLIIGTSHVPYNEYVTALRENGFDLATRSLGASRSVYVSDTDDAAWEEAGDELFYEARVAREWYSGAGDIAGDRLPPYETTEQRRRVAKMIGSPETVARDIIELHSRFQSEVRLDWLFFNPRPACLDIALVNRSLRLFAEEVVPRVNQALDRLPAR